MGCNEIGHFVSDLDGCKVEKSVKGLGLVLFRPDHGLDSRHLESSLDESRLIRISMFRSVGEWVSGGVTTV